MAYESVMVIFWAGLAGLAVLAAPVALVIRARSGRPADQASPIQPLNRPAGVAARRPPDPDVPDIEKVDLHAEAGRVPQRYRAAQLVTWSVSRCGDDEEMNDESTG